MSPYRARVSILAYHYPKISTIPNPHDVLRPHNAILKSCLDYLTSNLDMLPSDNAESPRAICCLSYRYIWVWYAHYTETTRRNARLSNVSKSLMKRPSGREARSLAHLPSL